MDGCCSQLGNYRIHIADLDVLDVRRAASVERQVAAQRCCWAERFWLLSNSL